MSGIGNLVTNSPFNCTLNKLTSTTIHGIQSQLTLTDQSTTLLLGSRQSTAGAIQQVDNATGNTEREKLNIAVSQTIHPPV